MKINFMLLLVMQILCITTFAQPRTIHGTILTDAGTALSGANISLAGSTITTVSNDAGEFTLTTSAKGGMLQISSAGYKTKAVAITDQPLNIVLEKNIVTAGDEVVVVGYQSVRRRDLTGSITSVGAKQMKDIPINSAAEALNGRLAGVTATTSEGSPDAQVNIRVRGGMSITGDNSPLYVVDGVIVENALSTISPQDIQSIDVLKDASATAIYGARGGNGVIIITTKSGRPGKTTITYNGFAGIKKLTKTLPVLSPYDFIVYQSERSRGNVQDSTSFVKEYGTTWDTLSVYKNAVPVDWQREVLGRTGFTQTHNLAVQGGTKKFIYNFGYTFNNEKGIVLNSDYKRHLLNLKTEYRAAKNLKFGLTSRYTNQNVLGAGVSSTQGAAYNRLRNAVKYRPFLSANQDIADADPYADPNAGNGLMLVNPIQLANAEYKRNTSSIFNITVYGDYKITNNLSFRSTLGYNIANTIGRQYFDSISPFAIINDGRLPIARLDSLKAATLTNSNVFTYSLKNINNRHDIDVILGEETYDLSTTTRASQIGYYPLFTSYNTAFDNTSLGQYFKGFPQLSKTHYTSLSFFGRINYALLDRYLLSFNLRADGASKFGPGHKWGYFPGGSFAWRIKEENFLKNYNAISDLKLRIGYGAIGNNRIDDYLYMTTFKNDGTYYYGVNGAVINAYYSGALANPNLKWEANVNKNIGLDISLWKKVDVSVDYYINNSSDLLLNVPISSTYGYTTQIQNMGKTQNRGVEFQLNAAVLHKNNFNWNANFNIATNENKIVALGPGQNYFYPAASWGVSGQPTDYIEKIGQPVGAMYGLVNDGFYKVNDFNYDAATGIYTLKSGMVNDASIIGVVQPGAVKFKDLNGDGLVDLNNDRTIIGNPTPKFTGGLNQQFSYKNWDASVFLNFVYGNKIYNANKIEFTNAYTNNSNMLEMMAGRWKVVNADGITAQWVNGTTVYGIAPDQLTALNANATIWQPIKGSGAFYPSDWAIEDGSFLRLNNITIGYNVPRKSIARLKMSSLRLYITGNNLAVWTKYTGYDPEVSVRNSPLTPNLDYSAYPKSRTFLFGLNVTF